MPTTRHMIVTVDGTAYDVSVELLDQNEQGNSPPLRLPAVSASSISPAPAAAPARPAATAAPAPAAAAPAATGGSQVLSPLAGTVIKMHVAVGQEVVAGQTVVTLEAMKMNTDISSEHAGKVTAILAKEGESVAEGAALLSIG